MKINDITYRHVKNVRVHCLISVSLWVLTIEKGHKYEIIRSLIDTQNPNIILTVAFIL